MWNKWGTELSTDVSENSQDQSDMSYSTLFYIHLGLFITAKQRDRTEASHFPKERKTRWQLHVHQVPGNKRIIIFKPWMHYYHVKIVLVIKICLFYTQQARMMQKPLYSAGGMKININEKQSLLSSPLTAFQV